MGTDDQANRISVSERIYEGLEAVRQSGLTNMLDRPAVARIANELGFYETAEWVNDNREKYARGVFKGFEIERDSDERV